MLKQSQRQECIKYHELQKEAGLSNAQAAEYLGVNLSTIRRYRNGQIKTIPKTVIMALEQLNKGEK